MLIQNKNLYSISRFELKSKDFCCRMKFLFNALNVDFLFLQQEHVRHKRYDSIKCITYAKQQRYNFVGVSVGFNFWHNCFYNALLVNQERRSHNAQ